MGIVEGGIPLLDQSVSKSVAHLARADSLGAQSRQNGPPDDRLPRLWDGSHADARLAKLGTQARLDERGVCKTADKEH